MTCSNAYFEFITNIKNREIQLKENIESKNGIEFRKEVN